MISAILQRENCYDTFYFSFQRKSLQNLLFMKKFSCGANPFPLELTSFRKGCKNRNERVTTL